MNYNKKTYYFTKNKDKKLILYQRLRVVEKSLLSLFKAKKGGTSAKDRKIYYSIKKHWRKRVVISYQKSKSDILRDKERLFLLKVQKIE